MQEELHEFERLEVWGLVPPPDKAFVITLKWIYKVKLDDSWASKTKSWLWHRRLSHLNFGAINHLARHGLVRGLSKLKFEKDYLCSVCALGKSSKKPYKPKSEDTNQEKLYLLHMDLCGPMRIASVNGKNFHASTAKRFLFVERRNRTLIEAARTMLIYAKAPLFLWAEAVATACYTQNRSMIRRRHGKTPYDLLHNKPPDLSYLHVFGALCYPSLTAMASEHSSSGPALHDITPVTISSGLVPNPPSSTPFVPPLRSDWDRLAPEHVVSTGSPSSTTVDQDAPSPKVNHDLSFAHMWLMDLVFGIPIPEVTSDQSSSSDVIHNNCASRPPSLNNIIKWTKDNPT
ncbi:retrovirus-related pol polyprotein from transposon TNT 1-94 [Tanacetum coccineum]